MFVLEHKVEESKKLNVVQTPRWKFQLNICHFQTNPYLNLITSTHVEGTFKANLANIALKEWFQFHQLSHGPNSESTISESQHITKQTPNHATTREISEPILTKTKMNLVRSPNSHNTQTITDTSTISFSLSYFSQVWTTPIKFTYIKHPFWSNPTYLTHI